MKRTLIALAVMLSTLASCQSVPAERKNNCACLWQKTDGILVVFEGVKA
jgi:hypothetical protein